RVADDLFARRHVSDPTLPCGPTTRIQANRPLVARRRPELFYLASKEQGDVAGRLGIVIGDIRHVSHVDIWVNSENTDMRMARHTDYSISAIIRYDGAKRDDEGRVVEDLIADELERKVAGRRPVAPATVLATGSGMLAESNGVRLVLHIAAVQGE